MSKKDKKKRTEKNTPRQCILFIMLGVSMLLVVTFGWGATVYGNYNFLLTMDHPVFAAVLLNEVDVEADAGLRDTAQAGDVAVDDSTDQEDATDEQAAIDMMSENQEEEADVQEVIEEPEVVPCETRFVPWNDHEARSRYYRNSTMRPLSTDYDYKQVDASYYENSLFIGDSRIDGLHQYSGWENTTFCYKVGLTVYDALTTTVKTGPGIKTTILEELEKRQYENVYVMLGINELGMGVTSTFVEQYQILLDAIREAQPDARIIIMGIMYETTEYSDAEPCYNNDNINAKNAAIARLANGIDTFYLDMNPAVVDETGGLAANLSFDGVHLKAQSYYLWTDFMYAHGY